MRILIVGEFDPAGIAGNQVEAINKHTDHKATSIVHRANQAYMNSIVNMYSDEVRNLAEKADVLQFNCVIKEAHITSGVIHDDHEYPYNGVHWRDYIKDKRVIFCYHGSWNLRANPEHYYKRHSEIGDIMVASPDLLRMLKEDAFFMPSIIPIWRSYYMPVEHENELPTVIHTPTNPEMKQTPVLQEVFRRFKEEDHVRFQGLIIGGPHESIMNARQESDIGFDQLYGQGICALEDMSVGNPTITGMDFYWRLQLKRALGCDWLPFVNSSAEKIYDDLRFLVETEEERKRIGKMSRDWMEQYWAPEILVERLIKFYKGDW